MINKYSGHPFYNIKSNEVRNFLRGIIGCSESHRVKKALEKINKKYSRSDYIRSLESIRYSALFENNGVVRSFIKTCPSHMETFEIISCDMIISNINSHSTRLIDAVSVYQTVIDAIFDWKIDYAISIINTIVEDKLLSCFLIRVIFFIKNSIDGLEGFRSQHDAIDQLLDKIELVNSRYLENAIRELINPRTDYFNICKRISESEGSNILHTIASGFIYHIPKDKGCFERELSASYNFSLIDAFFYISSINRAAPYLTSKNVKLNVDLNSSFLKFSENKISKYPFLSRNKDEQNFFRESFLLIEFNECFKYKTIHGSIFNKNKGKFLDMVPYEAKLTKDYFINVNNLEDLCFEIDDVFNIDVFNRTACCLLENSTALVFLLNKLDGDISKNEDIFVKLMSKTGDIGTICPQDYLQKIDLEADSNEARLVVACLISINDKSDVAEHNLRRTIQDVAINNHDGSIKNLIKYLYNISPSVTEHLIQVCDETFISKLFDITAKPIEAIEGRASILEWYGTEINDLSFIERAKNLRIDVQISKQKETIDDSRIYVDPVKFTQWINDNILNNITLLLESSDAEVEISNVSIQWDKVESGLSHNEQIAYFLLTCYSEFSKNKLFGIASYLGRRIRHGTLKGTGYKEVKDLPKNTRYEKLFSNNEFSEYFNKWVGSYEQMLESLKLDILHINSKKSPKGMIFTWINSPTKIMIANSMFRDVFNSYVINNGSIQIPYIITDYCWRFIEEDLSNIKKHLMEQKAQYGVFNFDTKGVTRKDRKLVQDFCQDINSITTERFRTISSWFNKPSIASPSADIVLLFKAVISEVKGCIDNFNPKMIFNENPYELSGGKYFSIYDALYILIYNAAKYGKQGGVVELIIDDCFYETSINILIRSEVVDKEELLKAKKLIETALDSDFENAHVIEGKSGVKKLKRMEKDGYIGAVCYSFSEEVLSITASFSLSMSYK